MAIKISTRSVKCQVLCYHGEEHKIVYRDDSLLLPMHRVDVPCGADLAALGWGRREGRLPICPEHRTPEDPPLNGRA